MLARLRECKYMRPQNKRTIKKGGYLSDGYPLYCKHLNADLFLQCNPAKKFVNSLYKFEGTYSISFTECPDICK